MKNRILLVAVLLVAGIAQSLACTNFIVGKGVNNFEWEYPQIMLDRLCGNGSSAFFKC